MGQVSSIFQYGTVDSTNTVALSLARGGAPSGTLVTATAQTAGRGREGRVFHSAPGGIYTTLIVRPKGAPEDWMLLTSCAGLAVCDAIESCCGAKTLIKWPNDVRIGTKKVCGILVEGFFEQEPVILSGTGVNVAQEAFPEHLRDVATSLRLEGYDVTIDEFLGHFVTALGKWMLSPVDRRETVEQLRRRSCVLGKEVTLIFPTGREEARAVDIDEQTGGLVVEQGGTRRVLTSGEVSLRF